ncbi:diheme cytochrome c [Pseudomonas nitroreducens]|uniref:Diheme cytochrome c n=1 Tax=Pseudomonas nitroreducens TaxID=46680 RepID=A0ABS0KQY6_PSENT|nr:diheme cytochrome c [Pseudomonas nitroreducens]MBG6290470.1 diheme cytochrome c [Pseudomonas nitroreducens]
MNRKGLLLMFVATLNVAGCNAEDHGGNKHGGYKRPKQLAVSAAAPQPWREECSACHLAYSPGLLPPDAWRVQMSDLSNHYGSDASLDPDTEKVILDFLLQASMANRLPVEGGSPGNPPRITETRWFLKKHDDISASTFKRPNIGSAANCSACHRDAEKGDFDEDRVKIPKAQAQSAEVANLIQQKPQPADHYAPLAATAKGSGASNSCRVTSLTSNIHCDTSPGTPGEPATVIVWTQAADGTWTCSFSGSSNTGLVPRNCMILESRQENLMPPVIEKSTR